MLRPKNHSSPHTFFFWLFQQFCGAYSLRVMEVERTWTSTSSWVITFLSFFFAKVYEKLCVLVVLRRSMFPFQIIIEGHSFLFRAPLLLNIVSSSSEPVNFSWSICSLAFLYSEESSAIAIGLTDAFAHSSRRVMTFLSINSHIFLFSRKRSSIHGWRAYGIDNILDFWFCRPLPVVSVLAALLNHVLLFFKQVINRLFWKRILPLPSLLEVGPFMFFPCIIRVDCYHFFSTAMVS